MEYRENSHRSGNERNRRAAAAFLLLLAVLLTGCGKAKVPETAAVTVPESSTAAGPETKAYQSADGWELTYEPQLFTVQEKNGTVRFTCTLEDTGADYFEISYSKGKMPREVLYEQIADVEDSRVTRTEGFFGGLKGDWSYTDLVEPAACGDLREQFTGIEHNGGTLLIHSAYKIEKDEEKAELIGDTMSETMCTLRFTSHEPQREYYYVPGTYECSRKEEIEGKEETVTDRIVLNADHTGTLSFQDDVPLVWSSFELIVNNGDERYEYTVEGDSLMVKSGEEWISFDRVK